MANMTAEQLLRKLGATKHSQFLWNMPHWNLGYLTDRVGDPTQIQTTVFGD
jgi:hypothetical protein